MSGPGEGMSMPVSRLSALLALVASMALGGHAVARQAPSPSTTPSLRIEGDWVRTDPEGSGSFDGLAAQFPPAELTAAGVEARGAAGGGRGGRGGAGARGGPPVSAVPHAPGDPYVVSTMPCGG